MPQRRDRAQLLTGAVVTLIVTLGTVTIPSTASAARADATSKHAPTITRLSVRAGSPHGGTIVTISGRNLNGVKSVQFGGTPASQFSLKSNSTIWAITPAHAPSTVHVRAVTSAGKTPADAASRFSYFTPSRGGALNWSQPRVATTSGGLAAVSCPTVTFCAASDLFGNVAYFDGTSWSTPHKVDTSYLYEMSCPTATFCMAIDHDGRTLHYNGSTWTTPSQALSSDLPQLSCGSSTSCLAANRSDSYWYFDGSGWSAEQPVPDLPTGDHPDGLSCGPARCVVGTNAVSNTTPAELLAFDGSTWTDLGGYDVQDEENDYADIARVSCPTSQFCALFDTADSVSFLNGSTVSRTSTISSDGLSEPRSISCASSTFCMLINEDDDATVAIRYTGTTWQSVPGQKLNDAEQQVSCASAKLCIVTAGLVRIYRGDSLSTGHLVFRAVDLIDVSCVTRSFCMAAGGDGTVARFNGQRFGASTRVIDDLTLSTAVSCVTRSFCVLVSGSRSAVFNGTKWRGSGRIDKYHLTGVACGSPHLCLAIDGHGRVVTYDGSRWRRPTDVDAKRDLISVSCSGSMCAAIDSTGGALVRRHGDWSGRHVVYVVSDPSRDRVIGNVSCGSAELCMIASSDGTTAEYDGHRWHRPVGVGYAQGSHSSADLTTDVSCVSSRYCIVGGDSPFVPHAYTFDGSSWSNAHTLGLPKFDQLSAVSCVAPTWCLAQVGSETDTYAIGKR